MKEEKSRKNLVGQLEKKKKRIKKIGIIVSMLICVVVLIAAIIEATTDIIVNDILYICCVGGYFLNCFIVDNLCQTKIEKQIYNEKQRLNAANIKNIATNNGNLKGAVTIKKEEIVNSILLNNIEKVEFQESEDSTIAGCIANIYLKNGHCLSYEDFSKKDFLSLISEDEKEKLLDGLIETIKIQNIEKKNMKVTIRGEGFFYEDGQTTDEKLIELFEVKE